MNEAIVFGVLLIALVMFVSGKIRYDIVALGALLILTVLRIIPASVAYHGFGHPAVVTVGAVLVLSKVLENSGVI
ncbi:MAG: SLC13 family permease, partial [Chloroflexi bacterium]|nr:SLC13 family permease [Chloroflexota bacterium]